MEKKKIEQIFLKKELGKVRSIKKIEIGFSNEVYSINDKFILKICKDENNEKNFEKEIFFYDFLKDKIPVPNVVFYDNSKKIYNKFFMVYRKIKGDNLYSKWHLMKNSERKMVIKQLCEILKIINNASYAKFVKKFGENQKINWHKHTYQKIKKLLKKVENKKILSSFFVKKIRSFVEENHNVLDKQKIALVYWDPHFDNVLVRDNRIVGILDFERTELASIDYVLDTIRRMVNYPKKYMAEEFEKYAKKKDYSQLMNWFKEFYPELFDFENLDRRLDLYSVEHDLDTLLWWPKSVELKQMIAKTVNLSIPRPDKK